MKNRELFRSVPNRNTHAYRWRSTTITAVSVLVLFIVFIFAVREFREEEPTEESVVSSIANVLKPDPISQAVIDGAIDTQSQEASLIWFTTGERVGAATRGEKDERYYIEMKTSLPEIDREISYYQVWLLSRLPYDFISLGEMVTDEEGYFVLEWEAPDSKNYANYTKVIITVNRYEGSSDPGTHLVEGEFGDYRHHTVK
ncbi:anti-sigma factor [Patescibacteria group bacterium]|nr:MAG: anti-sigma factor [Patescibacteria group bacterium]